MNTEERVAELQLQYTELSSTTKQLVCSTTEIYDVLKRLDDSFRGDGMQNEGISARVKSFGKELGEFREHNNINEKRLDAIEKENARNKIIIAAVAGLLGAGGSKVAETIIKLFL